MFFLRQTRLVLTLVACVAMCLTNAYAQTASSHSPADMSAASGDRLGSKPVPRADSDSQFIIGPDDVLAVSVWKEPEISRAVTVRSDGKISLPLVGEVQASGRTPKAVQAEIGERLKAYIAEPEVTVIVQEVRSQTFNVLGEVFRPGSYPLTRPVTVVDAIALAGGFRDFAKKNSMYVLRTQPDGKQIRMPVKYKAVIKGKKSDQNITLQAHDVVVVP